MLYEGTPLPLATPTYVIRTNVPFLLRFWLNCGFQSTTFEGMHQFHQFIQSLHISKISEKTLKWHIIY